MLKSHLINFVDQVMVMDVRVGVVEHSLLQAKLKDKSNMQRDIQSHHVSSSNLNAYYS